MKKTKVTIPMIEKKSNIPKDMLPSPSQLKHLEEAYDITLIVLFGSYVRDYTHKESDLDIGILIKQSISASQRLTIWSELSSLFQVDVDLTVLNHAEPSLCFQIASDGIVLYEAQPDTWEQWRSYAIRRYWDTHHFRQAQKEYLARQTEEMRQTLFERGLNE